MKDKSCLHEMMLLASRASIQTIAGAIDREYAYSEGQCDGYVTDHTDLASEIDFDESEYRRELLNDVCIFVIPFFFTKFNAHTNYSSITYIFFVSEMEIIV